VVRTAAYSSSSPADGLFRIDEPESERKGGADLGTRGVVLEPAQRGFVELRITSHVPVGRDEGDAVR
jgi:hypothetical protein